MSFYYEINISNKLKKLMLRPMKIFLRVGPARAWNKSCEIQHFFSSKGVKHFSVTPFFFFQIMSFENFVVTHKGWKMTWLKNNLIGKFSFLEVGCQNISEWKIIHIRDKSFKTFIFWTICWISENKEQFYFSALSMMMKMSCTMQSFYYI